MRPHPLSRTVLSTVGVGLATVVLTCCGSPDDVDVPREGETSPAANPTAPAFSTPDPDGIDTANPQVVCDAFTDSLFSGNPSTESQIAPLRRAERYVSDDYRKTFLAETPRLAGWAEWGKAGSTRLRRTRIAGPEGAEPPDGTGNTQYRLAARRVVPVDARGSLVGATQGYAVYCTLVREHGGWSVAVHSQDEVDPSG